MNLNEFIDQAHRIYVARHGKNTQAGVATAIGIKPRTYIEYLRGTNAPIGMIALLNMMSSLPNNDVIDLIDSWRGK